MASVKFSAFMPEINGSIGGTTFQRSRSGFSVRNKPLPRNPRSTVQSLLRVQWAYLSQVWRTLTDAQRNSWDNVAPSWPAVDKFRNPVILSGFSVFMLCNVQLVRMGEPFASSGLLPTVLQPYAVPTLTISVGTSSAVWTASGGPLDPDTYIELSLSRMMSAGRAYRATGFRELIAIDAPIAFPVSVWSEIVAFLGQTPLVGARIWATQRVFSKASGNGSTLVPFSAIVLP